MIDGVQQRVLHQVFRRTVFQDAEVDGPSQPVTFDRGIEAKPMTPDWNGPLAFNGTSFSTGRSCALVGASLLAMVVNDNACFLVKRGALESIASELAPTIPLTDWHHACAGFSPF